MTAPQITGLKSDMPPGGYPPGTATGTVTATVALPASGPVGFGALLNGDSATTVSLALSVKPKVTVPVGASLNPLAWPADSAGHHPSQEHCYRDWAGQFGMPAAAKAYLRSYPTAIAAGSQLGAMAACGIKPVVCFAAMNFTDLSHDRAAFTTTLKLLHDTFGPGTGGQGGGYLVFEQEPNNPHHTDPGWGPAAFTDLSHARYADAKAELPLWPVLFCPSTGGTYQSVANWYPGKDGCDGIAPDHYCGAGGSAKAIPAFTSAADIVARDSLPAGVGWLEVGLSASMVVPTQAAMAQMLTDGANFFIERKQAGEPCAPWCWWNGPNHPITPATPPMNAIWPLATNPSNNYVVPLWKKAIAAIAAA
jgi:hypothetical protein